ncbi:MAG: response regulator transcription factor [Armatimonadota bacterium]|nr:response regulator transcription factor [Armatimonadota bacterium]
MKLLVVEDDEAIAEMLQQGLTQAGYDVEVALDGRAGLDRALTRPYALIVLDVMLPELDGWQVCAALRDAHSRVPILMLTARDSVPDRIQGLDIGADDYLIKPFDFAELVARIHALLRRDGLHRSRVIRVADLEIDSRQRRVTRAGREVVLTPREYTLLEALAARQGQILTREVIQERIWGDDESFSNIVDVRVGQLRKKIDAGHALKLIQTVHGVGYTLRAPDEASSP